jgi:probable rRNA maturation factor
MSVGFFSINIRFSPKNKAVIKRWIEKAAVSEGRIPGNLNYIFCDDEHLLQLNRKYLGHDTLTDIITFDYSSLKNIGENSAGQPGKKLISGDIFISVPRVRENAGKFKRSFDEELSRVIIHGILHLCGYKDKTSAEKKQMRKKENNYLRLLFPRINK